MKLPIPDYGLSEATARAAELDTEWNRLWKGGKSSARRLDEVALQLQRAVEDMHHAETMLFQLRGR